MGSVGTGHEAMVVSEEESGTSPDPTNRHKAAGQLASPRLPDVPVEVPMAYRDFLSVSRNDWRGRWDAWRDLAARGLAGGAGSALRGAEGAEPCRAEPSRAGPGSVPGAAPLSSVEERGKLGLSLTRAAGGSGGQLSG